MQKCFARSDSVNNSFYSHSLSTVNVCILYVLFPLFLCIKANCQTHFFQLFFFLKVSDGALRCFASLADRFTRRGVDPAPLAKHGLTEELLERLSNCGLSSATPTAAQGATPRGAAGTTPDAKGNANVSTVISLLSTLCRGSPSVTHVS